MMLDTSEMVLANMELPALLLAFKLLSTKGFPAAARRMQPSDTFCPPSIRRSCLGQKSGKKTQKSRPKKWKEKDVGADVQLSEQPEKRKKNRKIRGQKGIGTMCVSLSYYRQSRILKMTLPKCVQCGAEYVVHGLDMWQLRSG